MTIPPLRICWRCGLHVWTWEGAIRFDRGHRCRAALTTHPAEAKA